MVLMVPVVWLLNEFIQIKIPNHTFTIELQSGKLYFDGIRKFTRFSIRKYSKKYEKYPETILRHKRLFELRNFSDMTIFVVDIGYDGRLFFLQFDKKYNNFWQPP